MALTSLLLATCLVPPKRRAQDAGGSWFCRGWKPWHYRGKDDHAVWTNLSIMLLTNDGQGASISKPLSTAAAHRSRLTMALDQVDDACPHLVQDHGRAAETECPWSQTKP